MSERLIRPLKPIGLIGRRAEQLGLWDSLSHEEALEQCEEWLGEPSGEFCACGKELPTYATGAGICPTCQEQMAREKSDREANLDHRLAEMGVPPAYRHCGLETFDGSPPKDLLDWILRPAGFLTILGSDTGVGKTHLATAALRSLSSAGHRCWWFSAVELATRLNLEVFDHEQSTWTKTSRVEVLLLDDLGSEFKAVPNGGEKIDALLDERYRFNRKTIVTTNLTPEQLFERNGRLASRLSEGTVIERSGTDRRISP